MLVVKAMRILFLHPGSKDFTTRYEIDMVTPCVKKYWVKTLFVWQWLQQKAEKGESDDNHISATKHRLPRIFYI